MEMKVAIRTPEPDVSAALRSDVEQRLLFAVGRVEGHIEDVDVHLTEMNGPLGRLERTCQMVARLVPWGAVRVERKAGGLRAAITHTADRLGQCVEHELARRGSLKTSARVGIHHAW